MNFFKKTGAITLLLLMGYLLPACDVCGVGAGNSFGLLSAFKNNFIGIAWQTSRFDAVPGRGSSSDEFQVLELSCRYHFAPRLYAQLHQPYRWHIRQGGEGEQQLSGLSDTRLLVGYTLLEKEPLWQDLSMFLQIGGGVKFPFGKYDENLHDHNLPENFNIGNGAWGFVFEPTAIWSYKNAGLLLKTYYQHNAHSLGGHRFGDQWASQMTVFYEIELSEQWWLTPNAGVVQESIFKDRYANGRVVEETGSNGWFANAGVRLRFDDWVGTVGYQIPLSGRFADDAVEARGRISAQLSFLF